MALTRSRGRLGLLVVPMVGTLACIASGILPCPVCPDPSSDSVVGEWTTLKDWNFGTGAGNNITTIAAVKSEFNAYQVFGTYNVGNGKYGADTVAFDAGSALSGQPVDTVVSSTVTRYRELNANSLIVHVRPKSDAQTTVGPAHLHDAATGSIYSKYLYQHTNTKDLRWSTRFRLNTVAKGYWFAIWNVSQTWNNGPEMDLIEAFSAWDCCVGNFWHSDVVTGNGGYFGTNAINYWPAWGPALSSTGVNPDLTQWHDLVLTYFHDDTYVITYDGKTIQKGVYHWSSQPFQFLFEYSVGHTEVSDYQSFVMPVSAFPLDMEIDYSRVEEREIL